MVKGLFLSGQRLDSHPFGLVLCLITSSSGLDPVGQFLGLASLEALGQEHFVLPLASRTVIRIKGAVINLSENTFEILDTFHGLDKVCPGQIRATPLQALHHGFNKSESRVEEEAPSFTLGRIFVKGPFVFHHEGKS